MNSVHKAETAWADAGFTRRTLPSLTADEAVAAARKLWRHEYGAPIGGKLKKVAKRPGQSVWLRPPAKIELTSGNRNTWERDGVLYVNPDGGWWNLIHNLSHLIHLRLNPNLRPHHRKQEEREARMVRYAVSKGWLTGGLKREKKPAPERKRVSVQERRATRATAALARAEHRLKLAQAAVKRLQPKVRYYERAMAAREATA